MRIVKAMNIPVSAWPKSGRPRKPYTFHAVDVAPLDGGPTLGESLSSDEEWQFAVSQLDEPIHPELLKLEPGNFYSVVAFSDRLGLDELIGWGITHQDSVVARSWMKVAIEWGRGRRNPARVSPETLLDAWSIGSGVDAFTEAQMKLRRAFEIAEHAEGADEALEAMRAEDAYEIPQVNLIGWPVKPADGSGALTLIEAPDGIFARAWLELYDHLQEDGLPKYCKGCGVPFIGGRISQKYCYDECRIEYGDRAYSRDPYRKQYLKLRQRVRRGTMTTEEFEAWRRKQGR